MIRRVPLSMYRQSGIKTYEIPLLFISSATTSRGIGCANILSNTSITNTASKRLGGGTGKKASLVCIPYELLAELYCLGDCDGGLGLASRVHKREATVPGTSPGLARSIAGGF